MQCTHVACMLCTFLMFSIRWHRARGHIALSTWFCCTYCTWVLVGLSANLDFVEDRKMLWPCQELNPDSSVIQSVAKSLHWAVMALILTHSLYLSPVFHTLNESYSINCKITWCKIKMSILLTKNRNLLVIIKLYNILYQEN